LSETCAPCIVGSASSSHTTSQLRNWLYRSSSGQGHYFEAALGARNASIDFCFDPWYCRFCQGHARRAGRLSRYATRHVGLIDCERLLYVGSSNMKVGGLESPKAGREHSARARHGTCLYLLSRLGRGRRDCLGYYANLASRHAL
jgi:hypothetical protein